MPSHSAASVLPFFWEDYQQLSKLLKIVGSLICTGVPVAFFVRRHKRKEAVREELEAEPVEPELTMEEKEAAARIMAGEVLEKSDFDRLGEGGLCLNCPVCIFPNCGFGR